MLGKYWTCQGRGKQAGSTRFGEIADSENNVKHIKGQGRLAFVCSNAGQLAKMGKHKRNAAVALRCRELE